jgi:hypothetical protein
MAYRMSAEDRAEFDELMLEAGADEHGQALPSREIGPRVLDALTNAADNAHREWAAAVLDEVFVAGCLKRWKDWNRGRAVITVAGESYVTTKAAAMSVQKRDASGSAYFQMTLWEDMTPAQLRGLIESSSKRREAEATTIATARRLLELCDRVPEARNAREAAAALEVDLDEYLGGAEAA